MDLSTLGIDVGTTSPHGEFARDVEFSDDGFGMFVLIENVTQVPTNNMPFSFIYNYTSISKDEFLKLTEKFRPNHLWEKKSNRWELKNQIDI